VISATLATDVGYFRTSRPMTKLPSSHLLVLGCFTLVAACSDDSVPSRADGDASEGKSPAVMVSTLVRSPDVSNLYVGAFSELPDGDVDLSKMLEISGGFDARAYNGYVYVWDGEAATYTRLSVADSLKLSKGPSVSFAALGGATRCTCWSRTT
jgi:hypothetical protein